jgi:hypothetical protein
MSLASDDAFGRTSTTYNAKGRATLVHQSGTKQVSFICDAAD